MKLIIYNVTDRFGNGYTCNCIADSLISFINESNKKYASFWTSKTSKNANDNTSSITILNVIDIAEDEAKAFFDTAYSDKAGLEYGDNAFSTTVRDIRNI